MRVARDLWLRCPGEVVEALERSWSGPVSLKREIGITCSYNLRGGNSTYASAAFWSEKERFIERVEESRTSAIVYGPASNTVRQIKEVVEAPEIQMYSNGTMKEKKLDLTRSGSKRHPFSSSNGVGSRSSF